MIFRMRTLFSRCRHTPKIRPTASRRKVLWDRCCSVCNGNESSSFFHSHGRFISSSSALMKIPNEAGQLAYDISLSKPSKNDGNNNVDERADQNEAISIKLSMDSFLAHAGLPLFPNNTDDNVNLLNQPLSPPLELATTYERPPDGNYGQHGNIYSRIHNPTRFLLEEIMAALEHVKQHDDQTNMEKNISNYCTAYSSGMAAVSSILLAHPPNSKKSAIHVILPDDVYHGVPSQLVSVLIQHGISYSSVDMTRIEGVRNHILHVSNESTFEEDNKIAESKYNSIILWLETPSNPLAKVTDIASICNLVEELKSTSSLFQSDPTHDTNETAPISITTVVDSTWAPPCITQPLQVSKK